MKIIFQTKLAGFTPILAQTTGSLSSGASSALGIVMLIGFIFGTICVVGGGFAIRRGDADTGKLSIIGGLIIAGAPVTEALQSATTASEVQKLTGVLVGQNSALAATDKEIDQAVAVSVEQDIENRNDAQKQAVAAQEQQKAEVVEAFSNYRTNFQLNTQPPMFPTGN